MKVGFIGIGNMGSRLAPKLLEAGHELTVNDLYRENADRVCDRGAGWADSARAVAEASEVTLALRGRPSYVVAAAATG